MHVVKSETLTVFPNYYSMQAHTPIYQPEGENV